MFIEKYLSLSKPPFYLKKADPGRLGYIYYYYIYIYIIYFRHVALHDLHTEHCCQSKGHRCNRR